MKHFNKEQQKKALLRGVLLCGCIVFWMILSYSDQAYHAAPNIHRMHFTASEKLSKQELSALIGIGWIQGCEELPADKQYWFTTQAYRWGAYKDNSTRLMVHFKNAFTQGELACWSNSTSTALYGQKNMINRFVQELWKVDKTWTNPTYAYVRSAALELQTQTQGKVMNQGQWLDCYGGESSGMLCRKLTNIDGLEAFFPNIVAQVKARGNKWYTANDIYDFNSWLTDGREFIDGTVNLSIPLDHPQRWMPRWQQDLFKEFVQREFNSYDAQMYLSPIWHDPKFNKASNNPTLSTGKTLYVAYKEWLRDYKKFPPYVSNLQKTAGSVTTPTPWTTPPPTATLPWRSWNGWSATITNDPTQAGAVPQKWWTVIIPLPPTRTTDERTKEIMKQQKVAPTTSADQVYMISVPQKTTTTTTPTRTLQQWTPSSPTTNTQYQYQQTTAPTSSSRTLRY